jgi:hypothetical protein
LIYRRQHSSVLDVRSFRAADCDTAHYLVVEKGKTHRFHMERFNRNKLNKTEGKEQYRVEISNRFAALADLGVEVYMNRA